MTYSLDSDNNILHVTPYLIKEYKKREYNWEYLTENIRKALGDGNIGCGVFADSQKAFDTVDHEILFAKLNHYGIRGVSNHCFKSYLSNGNQYVSINGYESSLAVINCGVPQGSVLEPLLFLLCINDLNQAIKFCKVHHFAEKNWNGNL